MQQQTAPTTRTKSWTLNLEIAEESKDATTVEAALDTGDRTLRTHATAQRNPGDPPAPEIGDEYAAGRALLELGRQLLRMATVDAAENEKAAAHEPPAR
ncbi:dsRBD fold-containing protein [Streptomyces sp. NPDC020983]|uniref:dsRBD fold-containing protein n=1 Tax=Streptomyces sp. NPDC020983 TaxID=3365106 RepID=UPI00379420E3